jgi:dienelactone hydrolase
MRPIFIWSAICATISVTSAQGLESSMAVRSSLPPDELWNKIGDFCGMTAWDPAVERCALSEDGKQRTIVFFGGVGGVAGALEDWSNDNRTFSWTANSLLAPVSNYRASVSVLADGHGSVLKMTASYEARGISDSDARKTIDDAFYRGLCMNSPLRCSEDHRPLTAATVVEFDGLSSLSFKQLTLRGYLRRPDRSGPAPAVVLLHGCGGLPKPLDENWAARIVGWGYVTLTVDSFGPRGLKNTCGGAVSVSEMALDPYQALKFLVRQNYVDPKRVVVLGFSQGGWLGLSSVERGPVETAATNKFVAAAAFYPLCRGINGPMTVPTLILIGESDDWTPADDCRKLADENFGAPRGAGASMRLVVYPNAYHGFDLPYLKVPIKYFGHHHEYNKTATDQASNDLRAFLDSMAEGNR